VRIHTLFFASYRELVGTSELWLDLPDGSTVSDAVREVRGRGDGFDGLPREPAVAVNRTYAVSSHPLSEGDEVAFIPPVAGG
jgi:MoaE-MoaD fusion protein